MAVRVHLTVALLGVLLGVGGCATEPVFSAANFAVNSISYLTTGKSAEDHGLSLAAGQNCKLSRALEGEEVCRPNETILSDATIADRRSEPNVTAVGAVYLDARRSPLLIDPVSAGGPPKPMPTLAPTPLARYFVVASFAEAADAAHVARSIQGVPTRVARAAHHGRAFHRVLAGPIEEWREGILRRQLAAAGVTEYWTAVLCRETLIAPPCTTTMAPGSRDRPPQGESIAGTPPAYQMVTAP